MPKTRHLRKNKNAAPVMRGYPRRKPFASLDEVRAYFDEDRLVCLICGKSFVKLSNHVVAAHNMESSDEYKIRFGIPVSYGLGGKSFRAAARRISRRLRKTGVIPPASQETIRKWVAARRTRRPVAAVIRRHAARRLAGFFGKDAPWQHGDYEEVLRRVMTGRTLAEVGKDGDVPSSSMFLWYVKKHPELRKKYDAFWERQSFAQQARARKTGERYFRRLVKLRGQGKTWPQVASIMKVPEGNVRGMWYKLKRSGRLKKYLNAA